MSRRRLIRNMSRPRRAAALESPPSSHLYAWIEEDLRVIINDPGSAYHRTRGVVFAMRANREMIDILLDSGALTEVLANRLVPERERVAA